MSRALCSLAGSQPNMQRYMLYKECSLQAGQASNIASHLVCFGQEGAQPAVVAESVEKEGCLDTKGVENVQDLMQLSCSRSVIKGQSQLLRTEQDT